MSKRSAVSSFKSIVSFELGMLAFIGIIFTSRYVKTGKFSK